MVRSYAGIESGLSFHSYDAKGLLLASFEDPNPVMYFEHKALYRAISGMVPEDYYTIEIGKANVVSEGDDVSIITYGAGVHWAMEEVGSRKSRDESFSADSVAADLINFKRLTRPSSSVVLNHAVNSRTSPPSHHTTTSSPNANSPG